MIRQEVLQEITELEVQKKLIDLRIKELKSKVKENLDFGKYKIGDYQVSYLEVKQNRLDITTFKVEEPVLYKNYCKESIQERLSIKKA